MNAVRKKVFRLLAEMSERYPEWRLGQLVSTVALWARQPTEPYDTGIADVEDEELLETLERHLARSSRKKQPARKSAVLR